MKALAALLIILGLWSTQAHAWTHGVGVAPPSVCSSAYADGVGGATQNPSFYVPGWFTDTTNGAPQSGQTYYINATPWCQPGVALGYGLGRDTSHALTPASTFTGWAAVNCVYQLTGSIAGGPRVLCGNASSASAFTIQNIDFSPVANGGKCIPVHVQTAGRQTGRLTFTNNKFQDGPNCFGVVGGNSGFLLDFVTGGVTPLTFIHNDVDGNWAAYGSLQATGTGPPISYTSINCDYDFEYNAFYNMSADPISGNGGNCTGTIKYNFFTNFEIGRAHV